MDSSSSSSSFSLSAGFDSSLLSSFDPASASYSSLFLNGLALAGLYAFYKMVRERSRRNKINHNVLFPTRQLRQRVIRLNNGSTIVQPYQLDLKGPIQDQFTQYPEGHKHHLAIGEKDVKKLLLSKSGIASVAPITVMQMLQLAVSKNRNNLALVSALPDTRTWTWQQYYDESIIAARALLTFGFEIGNSVNIIGFNAPEFLILEMGAIAAGGKAAGIYTTNNPEACHYVSEHSGAIVVGVQNDVQLKKFLEIRSRLPKLKAIICWGMKQHELPKNEASVQGGSGANCEILSWDEFMQRGYKSDKELEREVIKRIDASDVGAAVCLIYTSGTTGNPKAVMISNDNVTWTARILWGNMIGQEEYLPGDEQVRVVSYLPLSHIAAQSVDVFIPIFAAAMLNVNATTYFADDKALKGTLLQTLQRARPTLFFGVPRVWEKFMEAIQAKGASNTGLRKKLIDWAKKQGAAHLEAIQNPGKKQGLTDPLLFPIAKVLLNKVRQNMGLDKCRSCFTGAAPINPDVLTFFGIFDIPILEVYGMSECTGPQTLTYNIPYSRANLGFKIGSCGSSIPGTELLIQHDPKRDPPGHGEICYRGRQIMMGYMGDWNKSLEAIDKDGWLHSGDVGMVDEDGMLYITGRIKELIITKGGENIAPVPAEETIKSLLPGISNIVMIGDKRHFCSALVTLKLKPNPDTTFSNELDGAALKVAPECKTIQDAINNKTWHAYIQAGIDKYNAETAVSQAQKIQKFIILPTDFSVPGGELGPTLKLKRGEVNKKYADVIEKMYEATA